MTLEFLTKIDYKYRANTAVLQAKLNPITPHLIAQLAVTPEIPCITTEMTSRPHVKVADKQLFMRMGYLRYFPPGRST